MQHVKSPQHEEKIPRQQMPQVQQQQPLPTQANSAPPLRKDSVKSTASNVPAAASSVDPAQLREMMRAVIREELPRLLRKEMQSLFAPLLTPQTQSHVEGTTKQPSPTPQPSNGASEPPHVREAFKSGLVQQNEKGYFCRVCNCPIVQSVSNLSIHLQGARHKKSLANWR